MRKLKTLTGQGALDTGRRQLDRGRVDAALRSFQDAERLLVAGLGDSHDWVGQCLSLQAHCLVELGRLEEAARKYRRAVEITALQEGPTSRTSVELQRRLDWVESQTRSS